MRTRPIGWRFLAALAVVGVLAAACGDDGGAGAAGSTDTGGATTSTASTGPSGATGSSGDDAMGGYGGGDGGKDDDSGEDDGGGGTTEVAVQANNFAFDPTEVEVASGTEIGVKNGNANTPHTFTVDGTDIDLKLEPLETEDVEIDLDPGTYDFRCRLHPQMTGTLTVT